MKNVKDKKLIFLMRTFSYYLCLSCLAQILGWDHRALSVSLQDFGFRCQTLDLRLWNPWPASEEAASRVHTFELREKIKKVDLHVFFSKWNKKINYFLEMKKVKLNQIFCQ
jgi:hypothetical protein